MKKLTEPLRKLIPVRSLYLEDIEDIHRVLEMTYPGTVKFKTPGYEIESLDDLSKFPDKRTTLEDLELTAGTYPGTFVTVDLTRAGARFLAPDTTVAHVGLLTVLEEVCKHANPWAPELGMWTSVWGWLAAAVIGILGLAVHSPALSNAAFIVPAALFALVLRGAYVYRKPLILLRRRDEETTFWSRHRDHIEKQFISSMFVLLFGVVLGGIGGWFIRDTLDHRVHPAAVAPTPVVPGDAGSRQDVR